MSTIELQAYDILKTYFKKEEDARVIISFIEQKSEQKVAEKQLATNADLKELELKIEQSKAETLKWFIGLFITLALMIMGLYIKK